MSRTEDNVLVDGANDLIVNRLQRSPLYRPPEYIHFVKSRSIVKMYIQPREVRDSVVTATAGPRSTYDTSVVKGLLK